jgi:hypothetical protein
MVRLFGLAPEITTDAFQLLPFHFLVPADQLIFLFLPISLIGYFALVRLNHLAPVIWLALASLVFYSVSNWQFVLLLLASVAFNYVIGLLLISKRPRPAWVLRRSRSASPAIS